MSQQPPEEKNHNSAAKKVPENSEKTPTAEKHNSTTASPDKGEDSTKTEAKPKTADTKTVDSKAAEAKKTDSKNSRPQKPGKSNHGAVKPAKSGIKRNKFVLFLLLICLIVIAAGAYWFYLNRDLFEDGFLTPAQQVTEAPVDLDLQQSLAEQRALINDLQRGLEREREQRTTADVNNESNLASMASELTAQRSRIAELGGTSRTDWLLAEAAFLLRLGNQRLIIERDSTNALQLLNTADQILRDIDELDLLPVRKALARDITKLGLIEQIDHDGIYFRLDAITVEIAALSMTPVLEKQQEQVLPQTEVEASWKQLWLNFKDAVSRLIDKAFDFRPNDHAIKPLLSVEQQQAVRIALTLQLEQAQVALLRQQPEVYRRSLGKVKTLLAEYFSLNEAIDPLIAQLTELQRQEISQTLPDISSSLDELQRLIRSRHARPDSEISGDQ